MSSVSHRLRLAAIKTGVTANNQSIAYIVPQYQSTGSRNLVIWYHGLGDNVRTFIDDINDYSIVQLLVESGYMVAASQFHDNNWGNSDCLNDARNLYSAISGNFAINKTIQIGQSMGGFGSLLSYISGSFPRSVGWIGIYPAVNLANLFTLDRGSIIAAYNISGDGSDYSTKTAGHDPMLFLSSTYSGFNLQSYASTGDTSVPESQNADALRALASGFALTNVIISCSGNHGNPSHFQPTGVLAACNAWTI